MKILVFIGGLGNQMFGYAFCKYMQNRYPQHNVYGVYNNRKMNEHYGLEINRWFNVDLPKSKWYVSLFTYFLYALKRVFGYTKYLDLDQYVIKKDKGIVYWACHINKDYIPKGDWLHFKIDKACLSEANKSVLADIDTSNSYFVHVRRGDYLSPTFKDMFEGCCTLDYYHKAIAYIRNNEKGPKFFVFSDDIKWVKENLDLENATFIDWNTGTDSPLDMYLMAQCKGAVMANSTFSYWGAQLGNKKKIVCCPKKWWNLDMGNPNIYEDNWILF